MLLLFQAKLNELRQQAAYIRQECESCRSSAYPNLSERLRLRLDYLAGLEKAIVALDRKLIRYQVATNPSQNTWRQVFDRFRRIAVPLFAFRTEELSAYLAATPEDHFISNVIEAIHNEIGLIDVHPVTTLHQGTWFAVFPEPPQYPLYHVPSSVIYSPGELPLIFHEIGHVLYALRAPNFADYMWSVVTATLQRKRLEALALPDPTVRTQRIDLLRDWEPVAAGELEELTCDVVGALLGGPAFTVAHALGLMTTSSNPFGHMGIGYPPLDCRMRLASTTMQHQGFVDQELLYVTSGWAQVQTLYASTQPRGYQWLYDDQYLQDIVAAVEKYLLQIGLKLYAPHVGGLRDELVTGVLLQFAQAKAFINWTKTFGATLRQSYSPASSPPSPTASTSSQPSSSSSSSISA